LGQPAGNAGTAQARFCIISQCCTCSAAP